jgi:uncharacterized membrane protein YhaH (DUF805 family)
MFEEQIAYLKDNPKGYWFKARLYGWGWTPATWQGWLVLGVYLAIVVFLAVTLDESLSLSDALIRYFLPLVLLTALLIGVCFVKGEKPRWQWGPPKEDIQK